jgi:hypothetical protein
MVPLLFFGLSYSNGREASSGPALRSCAGPRRGGQQKVQHLHIVPCIKGHAALAGLFKSQMAGGMGNGSPTFPLGGGGPRLKVFRAAVWLYTVIVSYHTMSAALLLNPKPQIASGAVRHLTKNAPLDMSYCYPGVVLHSTHNSTQVA